MKGTAKKITKIFVVSTDLPDFENYISIETIEEVGTCYMCVHLCMYVCFWKYVYVYVHSSRTCMYGSRKVIVMYEGSSVPYIH